jgi:hypothetical protein
MGCSQISQSLDCLRASVVNTSDCGGAGNTPNDTASGKNGGGGGGGDMDALSCLHILQGSLAEELLLSAKDIGQRGWVLLLLHIAKCGVISLTGAVKEEQKENDIPQQQSVGQCCVLSLHVLSVCCLHEPFVIRYASRESLPPRLLAQIAEEKATLTSINNESGGNGSADVTMVAMALLV